MTREVNFLIFTLQGVEQVELLGPSDLQSQMLLSPGLDIIVNQPLISPLIGELPGELLPRLHQAPTRPVLDTCMRLDLGAARPTAQQTC